MKEYQLRIAEAKKRDHRVIGQNQAGGLLNQALDRPCISFSSSARVYERQSCSYLIRHIEATLCSE
jgi:threonyl-tRNA synthetase